MGAGGRPPYYSSPEDLQLAIDAYFESEPDKPTISGLAYALGFADRQSLYDLKKRGKEYCVIIDKSKSRINKNRPRRKLGIKFKTTSQYQLEKYHKDPITNIRTRINAQLRYCLKNKKETSSSLPYSLNELMLHLESNFSDGMGWHNMHMWHIDHIKPISSFEFVSTQCNGFKECYSLENLQPLWASDNLKKGNYYELG